jgi:hypothetical protein
MIRAANHYLSIMVLYAITLHLFWSVLIYFDESTMDATAVAALHSWLPNQVALSFVVAAAALCAIVGLFTRTPLIVLFLIPQQLVLMASASGAIEAIWLSQFADGVVRSRAFLAADQCYSILAALGHTIAIVAHARRVSEE